MWMRQRNEHTIAQRVSVHGRGYWSGEGVTVTFLPAKAGSGIRFLRSDLPGTLPLPVSLQTCGGRSMRTVVSLGSLHVEMVEHLLAALAGLQIDNCLIEVDREELPGLDGSSAAYVDALRRAGLVMQARTRNQLVIEREIRVGDDAGWIQALPAADGCLQMEYRLQYEGPSGIPAQQYSCRITPETFVREIAPARTFVTQEQAIALQQTGRGLHVTNRDLLIFGNSGPVGNILRYPEECARHKLLDLIGDLSILGVDFIGSFTSFRGGHQLNGQMAIRLQEAVDVARQRSSRRAA